MGGGGETHSSPSQHNIGLARVPQGWPVSAQVGKGRAAFAKTTFKPVLEIVMVKRAM